MLRNAQKVEADHQMQQCLVILQRDVADFLDLFQAVEQSVAVDVQLFYSICRVAELFQISLQSCEKAAGITGETKLALGSDFNAGVKIAGR